MELPEGMELTGYAVLKMPMNTVAQVIEGADFLRSIGVNLGADVVDFDRGFMYVELAEGRGELIECGDHVPKGGVYVCDVLFTTHEHEEDKNQIVAQFDWPTKDRAKHHDDW